MRLAIIIPRLSGGGAEFVALEWAAYLQRHGEEVTVITTHGQPDPVSDVPVVALGAPSLLARVAELRRHLASADYDVLLALMPHWNVLALLSTIGRPPHRPAVLISGRNVESALRASQGLSYRLELALSRLLYRRADGYVAISHPVAAEAATAYGIDASRIWVVPNPATGKSPGRHAVGRGHHAEGTPSVTITVPARIVRQKRPELAIETAAVLRRRHGVNATVEYFGEGPEQEHLRRTATTAGVTVSFRGWVTSWFDEAASDAIVLLPSSAEGFGNVLVEAAGAGIPSVASSRALGVADAIVPYVTGMLTMGSSPEEFAAAVVQAMEITPVHAPEWLRRFSPEESGQKLWQVLQTTVGREVEHESRIRAGS